jgi:hypothetical protein
MDAQELRDLMDAVPKGTYEQARQASLAVMARAEAYFKERGK